MGEEKEKGRYRGKGYKNLNWIQFVYMLDTFTVCFIKTRIFIHKAFIFNHYFSAFNAKFYTLVRACLLVCPPVYPLVVPIVVPPKNIIVSQSRINKGFKRVRQVYRFQFAFCSQSVSCGLICIEIRRSFLTAFIFYSSTISSTVSIVSTA